MEDNLLFIAENQKSFSLSKRKEKKNYKWNLYVRTHNTVYEQKKKGLKKNEQKKEKIMYQSWKCKWTFDKCYYTPNPPTILK